MSKQEEEQNNAQIIKIEKESIKTPENWMQIYEKWQRVSNRYFMTYVKSWQMILISNPESLKEIDNEWENPWNLKNLEKIVQFPKMLTENSNELNNESQVNYENFWWNPWISFGTEQFKAYVETYQKFTESWMNIWK